MSNKKKINAIQLIEAKGEMIPDEYKEVKKKAVTITMNDYFLDIINTQVAEREGLSRNAWILEALQEKIERNEELSNKKL